MSTIAIKAAALEGAFDGFHGATIRWFTPTAGQTFVKDDWVKLTSGEVVIAVAGSASASYLGIAMEDALDDDGVIKTRVAVAVFDVATRLVMNKTAAGSGAITAVTDIGVAAALYTKRVSAGIWSADTTNTGNPALYVISLYQGDVVGDTGGRLVVGIVPAALQVDNSGSVASTTTIGGLTASVAELNLVADGNTATAAEVTLVADPTVNGANGAVLTSYKRVAIATVNSGATLVSVPTGYKARIVDAMIQPEGGAVTAATSLDLAIGATAVAKWLIGGTLADDIVYHWNVAGTCPALLNAIPWTLGADGDDITLTTVGTAAATATFINVAISYVLIPV